MVETSIIGPSGDWPARVAVWHNNRNAKRNPRNRIGRSIQYLRNFKSKVAFDPNESSNNSHPPAEATTAQNPPLGSYARAYSSTISFSSYGRDRKGRPGPST